MKIRMLPGVLLAAALILPLACGGDDPVQPGPRPTLQFDPTLVDLGELRDTVVVLRNTGTVDSGPIVLGFERPRNDAGELFFMDVTLTPNNIANLAAGASDSIRFSLDPAADTPADNYQTTLNALVGSEILAAQVVDFDVP